MTQGERMLMYLRRAGCPVRASELAEAAGTSSKQVSNRLGPYLRTGLVRRTGQGWYVWVYQERWQEIHADLLDSLRTLGPCDIYDLAEHTGRTPSSIDRNLRRMPEAVQVGRRAPAGRGQPRILWGLQ